MESEVHCLSVTVTNVRIHLLCFAISALTHHFTVQCMWWLACDVPLRPGIETVTFDPHSNVVSNYIMLHTFLLSNRLSKALMLIHTSGKHESTQ